MNSGDAIYRCAQLCTGIWVNVPGALSQVDSNDYEVWGKNNINDIYKRSVDGSGNLVKVTGKSYQCSASGNGYIWCIGMDHCSYRCKKACNGLWSKIVNKCTLKQN